MTARGTPLARRGGPVQTEAAFTDAVIAFARYRHWMVVHFRPGRTTTGWRTPVSGDGEGWPDLFCVRGRRAVAAELKVGARRLSAAQVVWLDALGVAGIECFCWTPAAWPAIEETLH